MQQFLQQFHSEMKWEITEGNYNEATSSLLTNYMLLTTEVSEVAEEFRAIFNDVYHKSNEGMDEELAFQLAKKQHAENIGKELADCMAYILKFANYFEIDLETTFYKKMDEVKHRVNKDQRT